MPLLYTMETRWLAWRMSVWMLPAYGVLGLATILLVHSVGFKEAREGPRAGTRSSRR